MMKDSTHQLLASVPLFEILSHSFVLASVIPLLSSIIMFLENYSRFLLGFLGCMAIIQQGYSACITSFRPHGDRASIGIRTATPTAPATAASSTSVPKGNIMIPWYTYPTEGAWTSMEELYGLSFFASEPNSNLSCQ
jgi:hypothetical protein